MPMFINTLHYLTIPYCFIHRLLQFYSSAPLTLVAPSERAHSPKMINDEVIKELHTNNLTVDFYNLIFYKNTPLIFIIVAYHQHNRMYAFLIRLSRMGAAR